MIMGVGPAVLLAPPLRGPKLVGVNGAQGLLHTLAGCGVTVCFANPGTSEMYVVAGLDALPEPRGVLCLFEGVATGAADGYGRMTGGPAAALLHLGPGLANGLANLHNARRAGTPLLAVVGDHASYHKRFDAPLESDIDALAGTVSGWVRRPARAADVGRGHRRGSRRGDGAARRGRHADPAGRRVLGRRRPARPAGPRPGGRAGPGRDDRLGRGGAARRRAVRAVAGRLRAARPRPGGGQPRRRGHVGAAAQPRRSRPGSNAARGSRRSTGWPTCPSSRPRRWRAPGT